MTISDLRRSHCSHVKTKDRHPKHFTVHPEDLIGIMETVEAMGCMGAGELTIQGMTFGVDASMQRGQVAFK